MTEPKNTQPSLPEDERKNPVYRLGQAVCRIYAGRLGWRVGIGFFI